jgi:hypothetical protein
MPDSGYKTDSFIFSSAGLVARYAPDRVPDPRFHPDAVLPRPYLNLMNAESRRENALSSRRGRTLLSGDYAAGLNKPLTTGGAGTDIHTIGRLKSIGATIRYAINGIKLYVRTGDTPGAYTHFVLSSPDFTSGSKASFVTYRPDFSSTPYLFLADAGRLDKFTYTSGTNFTYKWGISPPPYLPSAVIGAAGLLNSTGGQPYDYRYTYFNINTGCESNPSQAITNAAFLVSPVNQQVGVTWAASTDPQVTHVRLYRRGGTLNSGWLMVAQIAIGTTSYTDNLSDITIASNAILEVDNDPPVTTKLPVPVTGTLGTAPIAGGMQLVNFAGGPFSVGQLLTVGAGATEEDVYIRDFAGGGINAWFQYAHVIGELLYADTQPSTPMNLAAVAFERVWLAGDPNNPNVLYYSKTTRPESFSPAGNLEVGSPSDPIMGLVEMRGVLHVFTLTTIYQVAVINGVVQNPVKTGVRHGLAAGFAWCLGENAIWYLGLDGVYEYSGGVSQLRSTSIGWLFNKESFGPVPPLGVYSDACMAYFHNEVYLAYTDTQAARRRLIWSEEFNRWRVDSAAVNTMLVEEDTQTMVVSLQNGSLLFTDRVAGQNYDGDSLSAPNTLTATAMALDIRTALTDQGLPKVDKVYNEATLDIDTGRETVTFSVLFDDGNTEVILSNAVTCAGTGRQRFNFNINAGAGQTSKNIGFRVSGNVGTNAANANSEVIVYQAHVRYHVEAEKRKSADTYWMRFGTDAYKVMKQGWLEYSATDAAGVTVSIYADGNTTTPVYTFTLPQSTIRTAVLIRFAPIKAKLLRFIATSASDFKLYDESGVEVKPFNQAKGYSRMRLAA